jgi:serine O-acetyltransferase
MSSPDGISPTLLRFRHWSKRIRAWSLRPLVLASRTSANRDVIDRDIERWWTLRRIGPPGDVRGTNDELLCLYLTTFAEFRNIFYYRLESGGGVHLFYSKIARRIWKDVPSFELSCNEIGGGLVARHGYSSILTADRIGANCFVHHEVTIGWDEVGDHPPRIGDNVFIGAGAKILGAITIGDNARIGANAVVLRDVPAGCTAVGVPARIIDPSAQPSPSPEGPRS